ncbi:unnamed protein product [Prorocentrum cordatum]|uniref:Uncharacterized protein n=1 Tax=Prorocentrum cordatum TaxID=2364126 RepID=A0ABN9SUB4_9DINO|nr:unnamed protein product [Polarella glacialis]
MPAFGRLWPTLQGALQLLCQRELTPGATYFTGVQTNDYCAILGPPLDAEPAVVVVDGTGFVVKGNLVFKGNVILRGNGSHGSPPLSAGARIVVSGSLVSEGVPLRALGDILITAGSRLQGTGKQLASGSSLESAFIEGKNLVMKANSALSIQDSRMPAIYVKYELSVTRGGNLRVSNTSGKAIAAQEISIARGGCVSVVNPKGKQNGGGVSARYGIYVAAGGLLEIQGTRAKVGDGYAHGGAVECGTEMRVEGSVDIRDATSEGNGGGVFTEELIVLSSGRLHFQRTTGFLGGAVHAAHITVNGNITIADSYARESGGGISGNVISLTGYAYFHETRAGRNGGAIVASSKLYVNGLAVFNSTHAGANGGGIHASTSPTVIGGEVHFYSRTTRLLKIRAVPSTAKVSWR